MKQKHKLIKKIKKMLKKDQQVNIPVMDKIHKTLSSKSLVYKSWHTSQWQHITQWAVLASVVIIVGGLFYMRSIQDDSAFAPLSSSAAQIWNAREIELKNLTQKLDLQSDELLKVETALDKELLENELELTAKRRHQLIKLAIDSGKLDIFLRNTLAPDERAKLSPELAELVEEKVNKRGTLSIVVVEADNGSFERRTLEVNNEPFQLMFKDIADLPNAMGGSTITVDGFRFENRIILDSSEDVTVNKPSSAPAEGDKKVGIIMFGFPDSPLSGVTATDIRNRVFGSESSVKGLYSQMSEGRVNITSHLDQSGDVFGPYVLPMNYDSTLCPNLLYGMYDNQTWVVAAHNMAAQSGFNVANYDHVVYVMPFACGWHGIAERGGNQSFIMRNYTAGVIGHELGHNLNRGHAGGLVCTGSDGQRVAISTNCTVPTAYQIHDPFDLMGLVINDSPTTSRHLKPTSIAMRASSVGYGHWMDSSAIQTLPATSSSNGTYTIAPAFGSGNGPAGMRIPRGNTGQFYYLEYRQPNGYDANGPAAFYNGLSMRLSYDHSTNNFPESSLIDNNPSTETWEDAPLAVGQDFFDPLINLSITTLSANASGITIQIAFNAVQCSPANPSVTSTSTQTTSVPGQSINHTVTVRNNDPAGCPPRTYVIAPDNLPSGWTSIPPSFTETVAQGASVSKTFAIASPSNAANGPYTVRLRATLQGNTAITGFVDQTHTIDVCSPLQHGFTITPTQTQSSPGQSVSYSYTITNNDNVGCPPRTFIGDFSFTLFTTITPSPSTATVSVAAGASVTNPLVLTFSPIFSVGTNFNMSLRMYRQGSMPFVVDRNISHQIVSVPTCSNTNPTLTISPSTGAATLGSSATYNFTLRNNDAAACGSSTYTIAPQSVPQYWTMNPSSFSETLAPGGTVTKAFDIGAPVGVSPGPQTITIRATRNGSSNIVGSATLTHTAQGGTSVEGPIVYITSPTNGANFAGGIIPINSYAEVSSGFIGSVVIRLNNNVIKTCTGPVAGSLECNINVAANSFKGNTGVVTVTATEFPTNQTATQTVTFTKSPGR